MAITTFKEIQRRVQQRVQNDSTATTDTYNNFLPKCKVWINEAYERILRAKPWHELIRKTTLTIVASTKQYSLNRDVKDIITVFDETNSNPIAETSVEEYIRTRASTFDQAGNVLTGDPTEFFQIGTYLCENKIYSTAAEGVSVSSSSSSDISPLRLLIRGIVSGVEVEEEVTLQGSTSVNSSNTYDAGTFISLSIGTNDGSIPSIQGVITVVGRTSAIVYTKIAPRTICTEYKWIEVSPTPPSSGTMPTWDIWYRRVYPELEEDNDVPLIDCTHEIIQGAYAAALREDGQEQNAQVADEKFIGMVDELWASRQNPNKIEQMIPYSREDFLTLDFNRQIVLP